MRKIVVTINGATGELLNAPINAVLHTTLPDGRIGPFRVLHVINLDRAGTGTARLTEFSLS